MGFLFLLCHVFLVRVEDEGTSPPDTDWEVGLSLVHLSETLLLLASGPWYGGDCILPDPVWVWVYFMMTR